MRKIATAKKSEPKGPGMQQSNILTNTLKAGAIRLISLKF
ncbi:hypothetical protein ADICYQ_4677 [Cyclobacterium qasimii M12-11B]|uniref:Uncharacterized protein n=1 Tax=Cyclobacterium qasimii M12-11B TaxID=641524 RepID=S7WHS6_9BACT|nr:hypothetical protein ADICYQ_4677 [Cyclobacterium qasimii M12-11B]